MSDTYLEHPDFASLRTWGRYDTFRRAYPLLNAAIGSVLRGLAYRVQQSGTWLAAGYRVRKTGAGR